ncbi:YbfB/YjiJ family MFS transporter [Catenulispora pinistramenti]|uniref:YbfB/YjiJ family MFS transporter n=1 Tax=Catenulispora pinistramenti TaxID=2705254 RepID=UPI0022A66E55
MGVGRFVFTPILPAMHAQAGLSAASGANLATANYVGYLIGAVAGIVRPSLIRSRSVLRISLAVLVVSLAAMPVTHTVTAWLVFRLAAGIASALVFVVAVSSLTSHLRGHPAHLTGWAFGGVGGGIALSGLLILAIRAFAGWQADWWAAAGLAALLSVVAWNLRPETAATAAEPRHERISTHRWFTALFISYTFEGIGYIVAGTFLVAAIEQGSPAWVGSGAWVLVGLAAVPSSAVWAALARHRSRPALLVTALLIQAVGIALPALVGGIAPAMISAILFGATFIGVSTLALGTGTHLRFPRSVALLTAGYSVGQILGPLVVTPLLQHGYRQALLSAAGFVVVSAGAAVVLGVGFPHAVSAAARISPPDSRRPIQPDDWETDRGRLVRGTAGRRRPSGGTAPTPPG